MRRLVFPDESIGRVIFRFEGNPDAGGFVEAQGDVELPADADLTLLGEKVQTDYDLACLTDMPSDSLVAFEIGGRALARNFFEPGAANFDMIGITDQALGLLAAQESLRLIKIDRPTRITGSGIAALWPLAKLRELNLSGQRLADESAALLSSLRGLTHLTLSSCGLSQEPLLSLQSLTNLERASFDDNPVDDSFLETVSMWRSLVAITLRATGITGSGFGHLAGLQELRFITLSNCPVRDEFLPLLAPLARQEIETLQLDSTGITDAGLPALAQLSGVRRLMLGNNRISDAAVVELVRNLPNLTMLSLMGSDVTGDGYERIREIRPDVMLV